ncbi:hypothetical protein PanWU01x14_204450 [Parasponia andersonii]|uniref:Uncharacterized protein n=1 Tax=Parasponia andersonii TaxID=3476 RepID=A0A2P5BW90_PARAD|nr:hypothetical protein PanWU01x14_204450 [Parasponia andersonii]
MGISLEINGRVILVKDVPREVTRDFVPRSGEVMVSNVVPELTLSCLSNGNFKIYRYTNISKSRLNDICRMLCDSPYVGTP